MPWVLVGAGALMVLCGVVLAVREAKKAPQAQGVGLATLIAGVIEKLITAKPSVICLIVGALLILFGAFYGPICNWIWHLPISSSTADMAKGMSD